MLPLFHSFLETWRNDVIEPDSRKFKGISLLYVTPLRALNRDMLARLSHWGEHLGIDVAVRHGDTTQKERARQSKYPTNMLITTPETLQIMLASKNLGRHLQYVRAIVIDEVHELAQDERGAQLAVGLERIETSAKYPLQRIGLSATVGTPDVIAQYLGGSGRKVEIVKATLVKEMTIKVESPRPTKKDRALSDNMAVEAKIVASMQRVEDIVKSHRSTLIFINTRDGAESLTARFKFWKKDLPIGVHHGSLSRDVRIQMEDDFKSERIKGLICTSSLELGIDIGSADYTIQYNSPREATRLVQRVGRASHRLGEVSKGTIITTNPDEIAESMVIARRALVGQLEPTSIRKKPLSVLANQIAAGVMLNRRNEIEATFKEVTRSYPFKDLTMEEFKAVLTQMQDVRAIWLDENEFGKKHNTITYFYNNISMIPDEKIYPIIDITTRQHVGQLDEAFVSIYIAPMSKFIIKGEPWRVVELTDDDRILVEPASEIGAVPGWIGEEIPVPFEVAQEVGELRAQIVELLAQITKDERLSIKRAGQLPGAFEKLLKKYPVDKATLKQYVDYIRKQAWDSECPVPTDKLVTIDATMVPEPIIIINACFGNKVNETIGQILSALIATRIGASVGVRTDPYRIILELSARINTKSIEEYLANINPDELEPLLKVVLKNSSYLKWRLLHVGRKFGAIDKGVDHKQVNVGRLLDSFKNSPLYNETLDKILWEKLDVPRARRIIKQLQSGELEYKFSKLSPISLAGLESHRNLMAPAKADRTILIALKQRLEKEYIKLVCLKCHRTHRKLIGEIKDRLVCNHCEGVMLAVIPMHEPEIVKLLKSKKELTSRQKKELRRLWTNANLVMSHGKRGILTLVARGVGANTAARILARPHEDELDLLRDILKAEVTYARTRRFWD